MGVAMRLTVILIFFLFSALCADEGHTVNFPGVKGGELIKFVSAVAGVNFIYNESDLDFETSFVSGKPVPSEELLKATVRILHKYGLRVTVEDGYYHIQKDASLTGRDLNHPEGARREKFQLYKLQYSQGGELFTAIKQASPSEEDDPALHQAIRSMQFLASSNSYLFSSDVHTSERLKSLIETLDTPQRQVFIEVLVLETDLKTSLDLGLEWSAVGNYKDRFNFAGANTPPQSGPSQFGKTLRSMTEVSARDIPLGQGFNLGVIGDLILHKGKTFITLGSLLSALETDRKSTVVLHQKILTQDNKQSKIFVGDNIPFAGSIVETIGNAQQTTSNIEYRDVGVSLNITPFLGDKDVITLELTEEITEALRGRTINAKGVSGIQTTKTNMVTRVHVPDRHFLILSGMIRNSKETQKSAIPCLGGIPGLGAAFSKDNDDSSKRNIVIFVRPHIIKSIDEMEEITVDAQDELIYHDPDLEDVL